MQAARPACLIALAQLGGLRALSSASLEQLRYDPCGTVRGQIELSHKWRPAGPAMRNASLRLTSSVRLFVSPLAKNRWGEGGAGRAQSEVRGAMSPDVAENDVGIDEAPMEDLALVLTLP